VPRHVVAQHVGPPRGARVGGIFGDKHVSDLQRDRDVFDQRGEESTSNRRRRSLRDGTEDLFGSLALGDVARKQPGSRLFASTLQRMWTLPVPTGLTGRGGVAGDRRRGKGEGGEVSDAWRNLDRARSGSCRMRPIKGRQIGNLRSMADAVGAIPRFRIDHCDIIRALGCHLGQPKWTSMFAYPLVSYGSVSKD
jgi:hypothetical protein